VRGDEISEPVPHGLAGIKRQRIRPLVKESELALPTEAV
jgi:hypothetical protein